jgi:signal transduction protein with GAF and PtsI domain
VAVIIDGGLDYIAASGVGADEIVGTRLPGGEGLAGFVAATGQSLSVRDAVSDPRFARDVAERTGYLPDAIQVTPIVDADGDVAGVMSMLDRNLHGAPADDPAGLATFAELAAPLLPRARPQQASSLGLVDRLDRLGPSDRVAALTALEALLDAIER